MVKRLGNLEECIEKGLLSRVPPSEEDASKSIKRARVLALQAKEACEAQLYDAVILAAYEAMFHAARSLLIKDGYREKSHYCIPLYLEKAYSKEGRLNIRFVMMLDSYRRLRHQTAYSLGYEATREEAEQASKDSELFVAELTKLL